MKYRILFLELKLTQTSHCESEMGGLSQGSLAGNAVHEFHQDLSHSTLQEVSQTCASWDTAKERNVPAATPLRLVSAALEVAAKTEPDTAPRPCPCCRAPGVGVLLLAQKSVFKLCVH